MENRLLLSVCIGGLLFAFSCNISTSRKLADTMPEDSICETSAHNMSDREVPAQEVPMRLLDKLSELYGDNPPGVIGFSVESKNCPDFIGGVYINDRDTLVIQIRGDSATVRKQLEEILGAKEFIVENGYDPMYGARPLRRFIQRYVETLIAKTILSGDLQMDSRLVVDCQDGVLSVSVTEPVPVSGE